MIPAHGGPSDLRLFGDLALILTPAVGIVVLLLTARHLSRQVNQ